MTSQPPPVQILPQATIQHTFPDVLSEVYGGTTVAEDVWLSCYKQGETSVHGKVGAALHARDRELVELTGRDGVGLERVSEFVYRATCDSLGIDPKIILPAGTYADPVHSRETLPHQIPALATTPDGGMLASAFADGTLAIYALPPLSAHATPYPPSQKRAVEPLKTGRVHLSSIVAAHILPKTDLLASAGVDFRVCITALPSAPLSSTTSTAPSDGTTLQPRVTLTGHTRALTDLIPFSTDGLEIVTGAKDGTVRVWDVRKEAQAGVVATAGMRAPNALASDEGGIVYAVLSDGALQAFDVRARASAHTVEAGVVACGGLSAVAIVRGTGAEGETVAVGGARGVCGAYDVRAGKMRARWTRGGASIENIAPVGHGRVVVGGEDGLPYVAALDGGGSGPVKVESELVFGDIEAVRCFEVHPDGDPGEVWAAGDGGVVRRYRL